MVNVRAATTIVALRVDDGLGWTLKLTVPFPFPLAPDIIVIQLAVVFANQAQPAPALTLADPVPPVAGKLSPLTEAVKLHGGAVDAAA
jgi:hypothetical protein